MSHNDSHIDADLRASVARSAGIEEQADRDMRVMCQALVLVAEPIWRWGDGTGGYVLRELWHEAEKRGLDVGLSDAFAPRPRVVALAARDGWTCHYCGAPLGLGHASVRPPVVEHVVPKAQGGSNNTLANLVLACAPCNSEKGAQTPTEWLGSPCCDRHAA